MAMLALCCKMDCGYKNDGGAKASFNVDNCLDLNNHMLEAGAEQASAKNSVPIFQTLANENSDNLFQVEFNGSKSISSGFLMDKQTELSNIIITNEISKPKIDSDQKVTPDLSLVPELKRSPKQNCVDVVDKHQIVFGQPSLDLNDTSNRKNVISDIEKSEEDAINMDPSSQKMVEIGKFTNNMLNINQKNCSIFATKFEERNIIKDCVSAKIVSPIIQESRRSEIEQESGSKVIEENSRESVENCQSMNTLFSSDNNECISEEEEVYSEVDEIVDSDQYLAVASEDEENEEHVEENWLEMDNECEKTIDSLIKNVEKEKAEFEGTSTLSLNTCEPALDASDDFMSEDEVYEEIVEDSDEDLVLDKQKKVSDEADLDVGCGLSNSLPLTGCAFDVRAADDSITSEVEQKLPLKELESKPNAKLKKSVEEEYKIVQTDEKVVDSYLESELLVVKEEKEEDICYTSGECTDAINQSSVTEMNELSEMANPSSNFEGAAFHLTEEVNVKETSRILQSSSTDDDDMDVSNKVGSSVDNAEKSVAYEVTSPSFNIEGSVTEEMNVKKPKEVLVLSEAIDDSMDISDEVIASVDVTEKSEANKIYNLGLNAEGAVLGITEVAKESKKDVEDSNDDKIESAKVEVTNAEFSDDEFDTLVENFYANNENSNADAEIEPSKSQSDSEDELELLIEDFNATNSDDDCFIVEDTSKVIVISDDNKKESIKRKDNKSSFVEIGTDSAKKISSVQVLEKKAFTSGEVKLNSQEIDTKVKLKDPIVGSISNAAHLNSEQVSDVITNPITVTNSAETNSSSNEKDSVQTGNKLSSNYGLFPKTSEKFESCVGNIQENIEAIVNDVLTNLLTTFSSGSANNNTKLKDVYKQQGKDPSELSKVACQVADTLPKMFEEFDKKSSVSSKSEKGVQFREDNDQEAETDEIIIDTFGPYKMASECVANSTDSSTKVLNVKESQKRTFDKIDGNTTDVGTKKFKDSFSDEIPDELDPAVQVQKAVKDEVKKLIPQESSFKFITTEKILNKIAMAILAKSVQDIEPCSHSVYKKYVDEAENMIQVLDKNFQEFNAKVTDFVTAQEETFQKKKFNPQVQTRTVGVNVKIFRECDLPPAMVLSNKNKKPVSHNMDRVTKIAPSVTVGKSLLTQSVPTRPNNPTSVVSSPLVPVQQSTAVRRMLPPTIITNASSRPRQAIPAQRFPAASPNVTIAGNPLATLTNSVTNRLFTPRPTAIPSRNQTPISKSTIDLTNEGAMNKRPIAPSIASVPTTTVSNLSGQQNVLVPISNFLQMLPNTKSITQLSTGNQVQAVRHPATQPARQTILQPVRQGLLPPGFRPNLGSRTVTYFMPSNSTQLPNFGGRGGIPMPPFLSGSNPRGVQTIVVRMTTAAPPPPMSSIVNSSSRMLTPSQSKLNTNTATTATSHGLVLFPRAAKHPAPYPQSPVYPLNAKLKLLPPKPSLKGSRAPQQGIILSWNMNLQSAHADIANYQLFAYQETSGHVASTLWKKVGDVKALPLPMACTLTQFIEGHRYYFGVRAVDTHGRCGPYSDPVSIMYSKQDNSPTSNK